MDGKDSAAAQRGANNNGSEATILVEEESRPAAEPQLTLTEAKEEGLAPVEIEQAKKHGMLVDDDKKKEGEESDEDGEKNKPENKKQTEKKEAKREEKKTEPRAWDLTKEERKEMEGRTPNEIALYVKSKKDKHKRQEAEAAAAQALAQANYWKGKAEALEKVKSPEAGTQPDKKEGDTDFLDDYGADPEKGKSDKTKPITEADLEAREKAKEEKARKDAEALEAKRRDVMAKLDAQEKDFKEDNPDYTEVYDKFTVGILSADEAKLKEMFPKTHEREGVKTMIAKMLDRVKDPEKWTGDESATALAYEIGKLHPEYGQPTSDGEGDDDDTVEQGDEEPDEDEDENILEKRLGKQGRPSSAPLSGGANRRPVSVKDLTGEDLAKMPAKQFEYLWKNHRKEVERILHS